MNDDGAFGIADTVTLVRWLTGSPGAEPANWKARDFVNDDRLGARDLTAMKRRLLHRNAAIAENGLMMQVHTTYGGSGYMGQDLGSGESYPETVLSHNIVYDGVNYAYEIRFVRIPADAEAGA